MMTDKTSALELAKKIKDKEIDVVSALNLDKITNDKSNCFITIRKDKALQQAEEIQNKINTNESLSELAGIPVAIDDNIFIKEVLSTSASKTLYNFKPLFSSTVVEKIINSGMIPVATTNISEFGLGGTTSNSLHGTTANPLNAQIVSNGSAAAVSSNLVSMAFGSSYNGNALSLSTQAGVSFVKPTYGTVSRFGLVAGASSMEHIGVYAKTIEDCLAGLGVIAGYDSKDGTSYNNESYEYKSISDDLTSMKIAVISDALEGIDPEILNAVNNFTNALSNLGATIDTIPFSLLKTVASVNSIIASAEVSNNISRFDGVKFGYRTENYKNINELCVNSRTESFSLETKSIAALGAYVLSQGQFDKYYDKSLKIRRLIVDGLNKIFETYDCVVMPINTTITNDVDHDSIFNNLTLQALSNVAGMPVISMPCGTASNNTRIGVQVLAKSFDENKLLTVGKCYQQSNL